MHRTSRTLIVLAAIASIALPLVTRTAARADGLPDPVSLGADVAYGNLADGQGTEYGDAGVVARGSEAFAAFDAGYEFARLGRTPIRVGVDAAYLQETDGTGEMNAVGAGPTVRLDTPLYVGLGFDVYDTIVVAHTGLSSVGLFGEPVRMQYASHAATVPAGQVFVGRRLFAVPGASVSIQATYRFFGAGAFVPPGLLGVGLRARI